MAQHPGDYPVYSSSVRNGGLFGRYGSYDFDEELISWSVDGGGDFFYRPRHKFSVTNVSGFMRIVDKGISARFLHHQLARLHSELIFDYTHKAHPSVIRALYIVALPPIGEQRKIAAILSSVDDSIEATQAVIDQLQVVKKAMMAELLTRGLPGRHTRFKQTEIGEVPEEWSVAAIEDVTSRVTYGFTNPMPTADVGPWMLTAANVRDGWIDWPGARRTSRDAYDRDLTDKSRPLAGDILITKDGTLGRVALLNRNDVCINQSVASLRVSGDRISSACLAWILRGPQMQDRILGDAGGSSIKHIYISTLARTPIPVPSPEEQATMVEILNAVENRVDLEVGLTASLRATKAALMSVLLSGEVRVTPDEVAA